MHPRTFLHRTPSEPRASVMIGDSGQPLPVGFADVRTDAGEPGDRERAPIGFAPSAPRFVTELSFRRTPRPRQISVQASSGYGVGDQHQLPVGQAGWGSDDEVVEADVESAVEPTPEAPRGEHVPFYKRELTFRRKSASEIVTPSASVDPTSGLDPEDADLTAGDDGLEPDGAEEAVPFYKRELSLRRRKRIQAAADAVSPDDERAGDDPTYDESLLAEPSLPFGFAAPAADVHSDENDPAVLDDDRSSDEVEFAADAADDESDEADEVAVDEPIATEPVAEADGDELDSDAELDADEPAMPAELVAEAEDEPTADASEDDELADLDPSAEATHDDELIEFEPVAAMEADSVPEIPTVTSYVLPDGLADLDDDFEYDPDGDLLNFEGLSTSDEPRKRKARDRGKKQPKRAASPKGGRSGRRIVGLKIGSSQIAAAVVGRVDGGDQLVQLARTPLEPGIVVDGEVRDVEALRTALRTFFDHHKLPRKDVRIGVSSNRIGVRTVDLSGIDDPEKFDNAVRFKAHEVLPVSFSESVLDYRVVEERVAENGDVTKRVLLVVAPKDQVEPFAAACSGAGIKLAGIDLEALGLLRTFVPPQPGGSRLATDTATVVVAIGHESSTLLVAGGGLCEFTRVFDWGGLALQQSIAQELDVHLPAAETVLHGLSLSGPGNPTLDDELRQQALEAVRTRLTPFARELVSSLQFYQSQQGSLGIGEIVITGGTSRLEGLADALHQMIGVSVRVGDPLQRLVISHPVDPEFEEKIGSFAVPVGLAIEDGENRTVNLIPEEYGKQRRKKPSALKIALPVAAVVPLAAMGLLFAQARSDVSSKQTTLADVQAQIDALPEPARPQIDPALAAVQQQRAAALAQVLGGRLAWDRVLGDLSRVLPANVWLTSLSAQLPDPAANPALPAAAPGTPAAPPTGVTIEGYTYSVPDVAVLLGRLSTLPSLVNVSLSSTARKDVGKRSAVGFTIIADIKPTGGAQ